MNLRNGKRLIARVGVACLVGTVVTAAVAVPASAAPARYADYIVVLDSDTVSAAAVDDQAAAVARRFNSDIDHTYETVLRGFSLRLSDVQARTLARESDVDSVVRDTPVHALGEQLNPPNWGLDRIDQRNLPLDQRYRFRNEAQSVTAYVLDTGIRRTHQDFSGRVLPGVDFTGTGEGDGNGHGSFVAGIIGGTKFGVAKKIKIVPVKVLNANGSGTTSGVIAGVEWVAKNAAKPAVANMSLGGGPNAAMDDAVRAAIASGVSFTVAAGGSGTDAGNFSPARVVEALTIGASDMRDCLPSHTNRGAVVDMFAPGQSILGVWNGSDTATATLSGSSFSAPHVAGAVGIYLQDHPNATAAQVAAALVAVSTKDKLCNVPAGTANRLLFTDP